MFENRQTDPKPAQYLPAQSNSKPANLATLNPECHLMFRKEYYSSSLA